MIFTGICSLDVPQGSDAGIGRAWWLQQRVAAEESVVDLGGTGSMFLGWRDPATVTACDDLSGFGKGHRIHAGTFHRGDVCDLSMFTDGQFDIAVMTEVLEHVPLPWLAMAEAGRVAKRVLITVPCEGRWTVPIAFRVSGHIRFPTLDLMALHLRRAGLDGELGLLDFGGFSFFVADVRRGTLAQ